MIFEMPGSIFFLSSIMENVAAGRDWPITIVVEEKLNSQLKKFRNLRPLWKMLLQVRTQIIPSF